MLFCVYEGKGRGKNISFGGHRVIRTYMSVLDDVMSQNELTTVRSNSVKLLKLGMKRVHPKSVKIFLVLTPENDRHGSLGPHDSNFSCGPGIVGVTPQVL